VWEYALNHESSTWAPFVTSAVQYKCVHCSALRHPSCTKEMHHRWIWLNRGDGSATVTVKTVASTRWLDEQMADKDWDGLYKAA
jgi:phage terminase large subunit GpA-like protein